MLAKMDNTMIELLYPTQKLDGLTTSLVDLSSETMKFRGSNGKKIALNSDSLLGIATNKVEKLREIQELYKSVLCDTKTTPEQKVKHVILLAKVAYKHIHDTEPTILQLGGVWVAHKECFEQNAEGLQITDESNDPITRINEMLEKQCLPEQLSGCQTVLDVISAVPENSMLVLGGPFTYPFPSSSQPKHLLTDLSVDATSQQKCRIVGNQKLGDIQKIANQIARNHGYSQNPRPVCMSAGGSNPGFVFAFKKQGGTTLVTVCLRSGIAKALLNEPESPIETKVLIASPLPPEYADSHSCDGGDDDLFSGDEASPSHSSCVEKPDSAAPLPSYSAVAGAVGLFAVAVYHLYTAYQESSSQELGPR